MSAGVVFQQMLIIFLLMMIGYAAYKKGLLSGEATKGISALVVNICNPALLVRSSFERDPSVTNEKLLIAVLGGAVIYAAMLLSSWMFPALLRVEKKWRNHFAMMCLFGNTGFIGIPLVLAVLGSGSLIYLAVINAYFNLFFYTYGIWLASDGKGKFSVKNFFNIGNLSIIITLVIYFVQPGLPVIVTKTVGYMADTTTFLAMIVVGVSLAKTDLLSIFKQGKMYLFIVLRFLLFPIGVSFLLRLFIHDDLIYGVMVLMTSVPAANLPLMRVEEIGGDGQVLSRGIILSTIASLVTIPLVTLFV